MFQSSNNNQILRLPTVHLNPKIAKNWKKALPCVCPDADTSNPDAAPTTPRVPPLCRHLRIAQDQDYVNICVCKVLKIST